MPVGVVKVDSSPPLFPGPWGEGVDLEDGEFFALVLGPYATQAALEVAPVVLLYVPAAHGMGAEEAVGHQLPAGHRVSVVVSVVQ